MTKYEALQLLGLTGKVSNEEIKLAYRRKAKDYHPDRNPAGNEIMKMINAAYDMVKDENDITVFENEKMANYPDELSEALNAVMGLGLTIEICGLWIWVSGDTKPHKEILKAAGYLWSKTKTMWYYRPDTARTKRYSKGEWSMDQIRASYGVIRPTERTIELLAS